MNKLIAILVLSISFSNIALAGNGGGKILTVRLFGELVVFVTEVHTDKPACSIHGNDWGFSLNSINGKELYALVLAAASQGKNVGIMGAGNCNDTPWRDRKPQSSFPLIFN